MSDISGKHEAHPKLGQFASTAICGNDITSSCLYVSAVAIGAAGKIAPFALLIVAAMLFLFRKIYAEVVGALPLNGGAYNALLNTTSKSRASVAACLTILSYMATAVISANEAMHYLKVLITTLDAFPATIILLGLFTVLTVWGISESANVAIFIFVTHLVTLTLLVIAGLIFVCGENGLDVARTNWSSEITIHKEDEDSGKHVAAKESETDPQESGTDQDVDDEHGAPKTYTKTKRSFFYALFIGFGVALLGISGFESSANFVEEQEPGVFPKTLRNMWLAVSIFNPAMAFLAIALIPIDTIQTDESLKLQLLAKMGSEALGGGTLGQLFASFISIDAVLVLSGAVLTSFVGVNGLVRRMALDRCLPQFLMKTNRRGTTHRILISFFLLCCSVHYITNGNVEQLAGVYTISFLTVMTLFGVGNILLKVKRARLPRPVQANWGAVLIAISGVLIGLVASVAKDPDYLRVFAMYFLPMMSVIGIMLYRIAILKLMLGVVRTVMISLVKPMRTAAEMVRKKIEDINSQQVVFFTRGDNIANLNNAMIYVAENEDTNRIKVVTVVNDESEVPKYLKRDLEFLDQAYPEVDIEFVVITGKFGPDLIARLSKEWHVPTNLMFIGSPGGKLTYGLAELGGVRLII
ncbi:MAG: APC family permease [Planctomycetales bacterium]|nr:APC family permease [Planctomycetales bacterium]